MSTLLPSRPKPVACGGMPHDIMNGTELVVVRESCVWIDCAQERMRLAACEEIQVLVVANIGDHFTRIRVRLPRLRPWLQLVAVGHQMVPLSLGLTDEGLIGGPDSRII